MIAHGVVEAAEDAVGMLSGGGALKDVWRFAVIQLLDDYESRLRREGVAAAAILFRETPDPTGDPRVDAAFAALAEHLARRDGWSVPEWADSRDRVSLDWWFVTDLRGLHPLALRESPLSFRKRGVFITASALERV
ncbi:hypothetical protein SAMN05421803_14123 [Nocardiopsis flavescens]|uniref:Uncharacterized protein n=1 Tax=Nocardiopsis flavescens TaxID=758803 RepID=A0A1M6W9A0_9ACTN|nr:hypothetical protein [Nocardiopsis flavescens]SHK90350.1 hypothetical protein SAMN05421803_14123 [Nocardiopsis flavescens]